jgi:hypothetical protein
MNALFRKSMATDSQAWLRNTTRRRVDLTTLDTRLRKGRADWLVISPAEVGSLAHTLVPTSAKDTSPGNTNRFAYWEGLIITSNITQCPSCIQPTRRFGSWSYSRLKVAGCHFVVFSQFLLIIERTGSRHWSHWLAGPLRRSAGYSLRVSSSRNTLRHVSGWLRDSDRQTRATSCFPGPWSHSASESHV